MADLLLKIGKYGVLPVAFGMSQGCITSNENIVPKEDYIKLRNEFIKEKKSDMKKDTPLEKIIHDENIAKEDFKIKDIYSKDQIINEFKGCNELVKKNINKILNTSIVDTYSVKLNDKVTITGYIDNRKVLGKTNIDEEGFNLSIINPGYKENTLKHMKAMDALYVNGEKIDGFNDKFKKSLNNVYSSQIIELIIDSYDGIKKKEIKKVNDLYTNNLSKINDDRKKALKKSNMNQYKKLVKKTQQYMQNRNEAIGKIEKKYSNLLDDLKDFKEEYSKSEFIFKKQ